MGALSLEHEHLTDSRLEITPSVTVHSLLEAYPELEAVLIGIAPPFEKLRNPVLRRSVAKIATLRQASSVGRVPLDELIAQLRDAVGQTQSTTHYSDHDYFCAQPAWFDADKIRLVIDEAKLSNHDEMTLGPMLRGAKNLQGGDIIELVTSFLPAPGIDVMKAKGYRVWVCSERDDLIKTYLLKPERLGSLKS